MTFLLAFVLFHVFGGNPPQTIESASWLVGCWEMREGRRVVQENWMRPLGNTMISTGRTVRGDSLVDYELVILRAAAKGYRYEAHPAGQPTAVFSSVETRAGKIVFENKAHDFPQQIGYARQGRDSLLAWIAGPMNGKQARIEFRYRRVSCS